MSLGLEQEGEKNVSGHDVVCPREASIIASVHMAMLHWFMCHCVDVTVLILRNQDTSIPHFTIVRVA